MIMIICIHMWHIPYSSEVVGRPLAALLANDGARVFSVDIDSIQVDSRNFALTSSSRSLTVSIHRNIRNALSKFQTRSRASPDITHDMWSIHALCLSRNVSHSPTLSCQPFPAPATKSRLSGSKTAVFVSTWPQIRILRKTFERRFVCA